MFLDRSFGVKRAEVLEFAGLRILFSGIPTITTLNLSYHCEAVLLGVGEGASVLTIKEPRQSGSPDQRPYVAENSSVDSRDQNIRT